MIPQDTPPLQSQEPKELALYSENESRRLRSDLYNFTTQDSTLAGGKEFDGSVDFTATVNFQGVVEGLDITSATYFETGELSVDSTLVVGGNVKGLASGFFDQSLDVSGAFDCSVLNVDATSNFGGDISVATTARATDVSVFATVNCADLSGDVLASGLGRLVLRETADVDWSSSADFSLANTQGGGWTDFTLADALAPDGAVALLLHTRVDGSAANHYFLMRENGKTGDSNRGMIFSQVANIRNMADLIIGCDAEKKFEFASDISWDNARGLEVGLKGWFI